ncbi:nicotinate-nucleotide--dimethylbenzimidazole phosphoribosyltransferase [Streptomyces sp. NRRL F-5123]|uniref:nicotinate-nucleotide--dimethylbenzimidazole phosphoribosyltransferase n=1 Tax=Streptomyces sp. NRRL F-5123 TaxID=1463856 RepID=UPI0004E10CCB|nr:nicotinate-nucleotide--dimethylbenzimidazole phosphoribosyltransferase [Streptomyces sp. NRRL F-5123]
MTDTGQIPGEGLPENAVGDAAHQPHTGALGAPQATANGWGAQPPAGLDNPPYGYLDQPPAPGTGLDDEDDVLLMPGPQGTWSDPQPVPLQPEPPQTPLPAGHFAPGYEPESAPGLPSPGAFHEQGFAAPGQLPGGDAAGFVPQEQGFAGPDAEGASGVVPGADPGSVPQRAGFAAPGDPAAAAPQGASGDVASGAVAAGEGSAPGLVPGQAAGDAGPGFGRQAQEAAPSGAGPGLAVPGHFPEAPDAEFAPGAGSAVPGHAPQGEPSQGAGFAVPGEGQALAGQAPAAPADLAAVQGTEQGAGDAGSGQPAGAEPVAGQGARATEDAAVPQGAVPGGAAEGGAQDPAAVRVPGTDAAPVAPAPPRRPLHLGPPVQDTPSGGVSVRSLADRGPAQGGPAPAPVRVQGPPTAGPEYLDVPPQGPHAIPAQQNGEPGDPAAGPHGGWPAADLTPSQQSLIPHADSIIPSQTPPEPVTALPPAEPPAAPVPAPGTGQEEAPAGEAAGAAGPAAQDATATPPQGTAVPAPALAGPAAAPSAPGQPAAAPIGLDLAAPPSGPAFDEQAAAPAAPDEQAAAELPAQDTEAAAVPDASALQTSEAVVAAPAEAQAAEAAPAAEAVQAAEAAEAEAAPAAEAQAADGAQAAAVSAPAGEPAEAYEPAVRDAVHRVIRERRDIRNGFRSDAIPPEVLLRVLEAAHTAPSVGHSQPWDFVVIRSEKTREKMHELAMAQREAYAKSLPKARARQFRELKIEAILDTPVNIVVTADPTRGGRHTLGRHTQPQMAPYSSALAVENLWLAARAEGLGVGWVSFFDERQVVAELGLPEHLEVVAYLCVGYVDEFPEEPELMQAGWSQRRPLSWVVHEEEYGNRALPGEEPHDLLEETLRAIRPLDAKALGEAWERQKRMTKPAGALGMLEIISAQLAGLSRVCPAPIPEPAAVAIFAGDHGVHAQGVTSWPQEVTGQMVANFLGGGAVCNAFANQVGAEVCVIDVGVASELPGTPGLLPRKVRAGTADFTAGPAMTREEALRAIEVGIETARDLVAAGNKALLTGEMGIANTTTSAALIAVFTGTDPAEVTGRGTGINDEMHARKVDVVRRALELHRPDPADPIAVLTAIGGLEHAAITGLLLGAAALRTPVILDGVSAGAAALVARAIAPEVLAACIAGHRSAEPGHVAALTALGLRPLVDLDLRLGEGTGALLALPLVQSAARVMHEVATFDAAGVTEKS